MPWISRILSGDKSSTLINSQLQKYGGLKFIMQCNFEKGMFDEIPEFYKDILRLFSYIFVNKSARYIIWNNKEVLIDKTRLSKDSATACQPTNRCQHFTNRKD